MCLLNKYINVFTQSDHFSFSTYLKKNFVYFFGIQSNPFVYSHHISAHFFLIHSSRACLYLFLISVFIARYSFPFIGIFAVTFHHLYIFFCHSFVHFLMLSSSLMSLVFLSARSTFNFYNSRSYCIYLYHCFCMSTCNLGPSGVCHIAV